MNPGIAVFSLAAISAPPAGKLMPLRGPIASMTSSRIKIPASLISEVGVKACRAWIRTVGIDVQHRNGNAVRDKTKRAGSEVQPARFVLDRKSTRLNSSHVSISYAV